MFVIALLRKKRSQMDEILIGQETALSIPSVLEVDITGGGCFFVLLEIMRPTVSLMFRKTFRAESGENTVD